MDRESVDIWVKIIEEDQKHKRECGWSYFENPYEIDNNDKEVKHED